VDRFACVTVEQLVQYRFSLGMEWFDMLSSCVFLCQSCVRCIIIEFYSDMYILQKCYQCHVK
jgi:hypothetical protein